MPLLDVLIQEIDTILAAPYPSSLLALGGILGQATINELTAWTLAKPCQIDTLITRLTQRLAYDEIIESILLRLIQQQALCESLCRLRPEVLESIFSNAVAQLRTAASETVQRHTYLLEVPLPGSFGLPANYAELIALLLPVQATEPASIWLQRFRRFLISIRSVDLFYVKDDVLAKLYDQWRTLLRCSTHYDQMSAVYIGALLYRHCGSDYSPIRSSPSIVASCPEGMKVWMDKLHSMFVGDRACNTISTTVLCILKYCSDPSSASEAISRDAVKMAQVILSQISSSELDSWLRQNPQPILKIVEKISRPDTDAQFRLEVFYILCLIDATSVSSDHVCLMAALASGFDGGVALGNSVPPEFRVTRHNILKYVMHSMRTLDKEGYRNLLQKMLCYILQQCQPDKSVTIDNTLHQENAICFIEVLLSELQEADSKSDTIATDVLCSLAVPEWWPLNLFCSEDMDNCLSLKVCPYEFRKQRLKIATRISFLILQAASVTGVRISSDLFKLIENQIRETSDRDGSPTCHFVQPQRSFLRIGGGAINNPSLLPHSNIELTQFERITEKWSAEVEFYVHTLCKDLQDRCDKIEIPLHAATEQTRKLQSELEAMRLKLQESHESRTALQNSGHQMQQHVATLESRLEHCHNHNDSIQRKVLDLENRCKYEADEFAQALARADEQAKIKAAAAENNHREQVVELQAQLELSQISNCILQKELEFMTQCALDDRREILSKHEVELFRLNETHQHKAVVHEAKIYELTQSIATLQTKVARMESSSAANLDSLRDISAKYDMKQQQNIELEGIISVHKTEAQKSKEHSELDLVRIEQLVCAQSEDKSQLEEKTRRIAELEKALLLSQRQTRASTQALKKARMVEKRVLAIFQGSQHSVVQTTSSAVNSPPISPLDGEADVSAAIKRYDTSLVLFDEDEDTEISDLEKS